MRAWRKVPPGPSKGRDLKLDLGLDVRVPAQEGEERGGEQGLETLPMGRGRNQLQEGPERQGSRGRKCRLASEAVLNPLWQSGSQTRAV